MVVGKRMARMAIALRELEKTGKTRFLMEWQDDSIPQPPAQGKPLSQSTSPAGRSLVPASGPLSVLLSTPPSAALLPQGATVQVP
jgi:hypothetical protein